MNMSISSDSYHTKRFDKKLLSSFKTQWLLVYTHDFLVWNTSQPFILRPNLQWPKNVIYLILLLYLKLMLRVLKACNSRVHLVNWYCLSVYQSVCFTTHWVDSLSCGLWLKTASWMLFYNLMGCQLISDISRLPDFLAGDGDILCLTLYQLSSFLWSKSLAYAHGIIGWYNHKETN